MYVESVDTDSGRESRLGVRSWVLPRRVNWQPDSSGVIFASSQAGGPSVNSQLWDVSYPQGNARRITNDLNLYVDETITADGSAIVTVQTAILANLWVAYTSEIAHPQGAKQITSGPNLADGYLGLSWMPDGRILYGYYDRGEARLATISPDGSKSTDIRFPPGFYDSASACGDRRTIVFRADISGTRGIWRADSDGGNLRNIVRDVAAFAPACSPDAKTVVYTTVKANEPRLWKVPTDGGQPLQLSGDSLLFPAISPDGRSIAALHAVSPNELQQFAILRADGGPILATFELSFGFFFIGEGGAALRWAPDGGSLVYIVNHNGGSDLWAQPVHLANASMKASPKQLISFSGDPIFTFAWSTKGDQLALARGRISADAVLISHFR